MRTTYTLGQLVIFGKNLMSPYSDGFKFINSVGVGLNGGEMSVG